MANVVTIAASLGGSVGQADQHGPKVGGQNYKADLLLANAMLSNNCVFFLFEPL